MRALAILAAVTIGLMTFIPAYAQSAKKPGAAKSSTTQSKKAKAGKASAGKSQPGGDRRIKPSPVMDHAGNPGYE
jgi:hypothetical protein